MPPHLSVRTSVSAGELTLEFQRLTAQLKAARRTARSLEQTVNDEERQGRVSAEVLEHLQETRQLLTVYEQAYEVLRRQVGGAE